MFAVGINATTYRNYSDVYNTIYTNHYTNLRPVLNASHPVNLSVDFVLISLEGLSEGEQSITTNGWFVLNWQDPALSCGGDRLLVQQKNIWLPDITLKNSVKKRSKIGSSHLTGMFCGRLGIYMSRHVTSRLHITCLMYSAVRCRYTDV